MHLWQVPGKHVSVLLSQGVVWTILKSRRKRFGRKSERGGILLGRVEHHGSEILVHVDEHFEVPCEYLFGPRYSLSEGDKEHFQEALDDAERAYPGLEAVGFYRLHGRKGLGLDEDDLALYDEFFSGPERVALLVKRHRLRASRAAFFFREDDWVSSEASYLELPVRAGRPPKPATARFWCSLWAQAPLFAFLLFTYGLLGFLSARQWNQLRQSAQPPRDPYALSLLVLEYGDNLQLTWDREAPSIRTAAGAVLHISDGDQTRSIDLTSSQLKTGSVTYRRLNPRVRFVLEVSVTGHRAVSETWDSRTSPATATP